MNVANQPGQTFVTSSCPSYHCSCSDVYCPEYIGSTFPGKLTSNSRQFALGPHKFIDDFNILLDELAIANAWRCRLPQTCDKFFGQLAMCINVLFCMSIRIRTPRCHSLNLRCLHLVLGRILINFGGSFFWDSFNDVCKKNAVSGERPQQKKPVSRELLCREKLNDKRSTLVRSVSCLWAIGTALLDLLDCILFTSFDHTSFLCDSALRDPTRCLYRRPGVFWFFSISVVLSLLPLRCKSRIMLLCFQLFVK